MNINIQSISDIITNSSTEVFVMYDPSNIKAIKDTINAILAIDGTYIFDDLFDIHMTVDEDFLDQLYEDNDDIQKEYASADAFIEAFKTFSFEEMRKYNDMWWDAHSEWQRSTLFNGYSVSLKENVEWSATLQKALDAIRCLDNIFDYDYTIN